MRGLASLHRGPSLNPLILFLLFASLVSSKTLTLKATLEQSSQPKCFDYTTTLFDVDTDNDLGFTTGFTMDPQRQCMIDIKSGITRIVYEKGMIVQMFGFNSIGNAVSLGRVANGQIVYWYDFSGNAQQRRFLFSNPTDFPLSFRVTL